MNVRLLLTGLVLSASVSGAVAATTVYELGSSLALECESASHGLWTNQTFGGTCANYFDISGVFTYEEGVTATLIGSAVDPQELVADIDLALADFTETGRYKQDPGEFGAGAWMTPEQISGTTGAGGNHWDLNLQLTRQVPEPGGLALLGAAALAFGAPRLRRRL